MVPAGAGVHLRGLERRRWSRARGAIGRRARGCADAAARSALFRRRRRKECFGIAAVRPEAVGVCGPRRIRARSHRSAGARAAETGPSGQGTRRRARSAERARPASRAPHRRARAPARRDQRGARGARARAHHRARCARPARRRSARVTPAHRPARGPERFAPGRSGPARRCARRTGAHHRASSDARLVGAPAVASREARMATVARRMSGSAAASGVRRTPDAGDPVDVVIPVYNAAEDLARCVESVLEHTANYRLVLIDDASPDPLVAKLFSELERLSLRDVVLLRNERNLGFTGTANRAMELSRADVVLLNSDTVVTAGWLHALVRCAASDPSIGTITP